MTILVTNAAVSTGDSHPASETEYLLSVIPKTVPAAKRALGALERDIAVVFQPGTGQR